MIAVRVGSDVKRHIMVYEVDFCRVGCDVVRYIVVCRVDFHRVGSDVKRCFCTPRLTGFKHACKLRERGVSFAFGGMSTWKGEGVDTSMGKHEVEGTWGNYCSSDVTRP